jgi:2,3-bisphosphoglycerate-independent phosphoglycerate mutase
MPINRKAVLIIMDGWGHGTNAAASAIAGANTPNVTSYYKKYLNTELRTDGLFVGLPEGQMGNSEVGHLNLGAGRIVFQELQRIFNAIQSGELESNPSLQSAFSHAKAGGKLHIMGLVSDGGVHSHTKHLKALCQLAMKAGVPKEKLFVHAFTDGRDTDPKSGAGYVKDLESFLANNGGRVASVIGRYYAMDRDKRWERIKKAYDLLIHGIGQAFPSATEAIQAGYGQGITDEFLEASIVTDSQGAPIATISAGDTVICFNFRTDRCRQITRALTQEDFPEHNMHPISLHYLTMTRYDQTFKNMSVIFGNEDLTDTLGEVLERSNKKQIRIAETEKYPHVTFFFSGGREATFTGETRIMRDSPKVATYDLQPEMSAFQLRDAIIPELEKGDVDFVCLNFANADMVGHTGIFEAAVKACETVDTCVGDVVHAAINHGYDVLLTADHGNSDYLINEDGSPNTAHTTNPVPLFYISMNPAYSHLKPGKLGDIAPTILTMMGLEIPVAMTGEVLLQK